MCADADLHFENVFIWQVSHFYLNNHYQLPRLNQHQHTHTHTHKRTHTHLEPSTQRYGNIDVPHISSQDLPDLFKSLRNKVLLIPTQSTAAIYSIGLEITFVNLIHLTLSIICTSSMNKLEAELTKPDL